MGARQTAERADVLRQPGHPPRPHRAPGGLDLRRHRVEPRAAGTHRHQLLAGECGRGRERGRLRHPGHRRGGTDLPHRLGGAPHAPPRRGPPGRGHPAVQPDAAPASLLLLEQHRLPAAARHPVHLPDVPGHRPLRHDLLPLAGERRRGPHPAAELPGTHFDLRLPLGGGLLRGLRLGNRPRHRPDRRPPGTSGQEGLDLGTGGRRRGEPARAHRRGRRLYRSPERAAPDAVRLRLAPSGSDGLLGGAVGPGLRSRRRVRVRDAGPGGRAGGRRRRRPVPLPRRPGPPRRRDHAGERGRGRNPPGRPGPDGGVPVLDRRGGAGPGGLARRAGGGRSHLARRDAAGLPLAAPGSGRGAAAAPGTGRAGDRRGRLRRR